MAHLLDGSLPPHLQEADRGEALSTAEPPRDLAPRSTPPQVPSRRNVFDDDELDRLDMDVSSSISASAAPIVLRMMSWLTVPRLRIRRRSSLRWPLSSSDDDERDDTYDAEDVGGTVDAAAEDLIEGSEEALFRAFKANPKVFERDQATRKAAERARLKDLTRA